MRLKRETRILKHKAIASLRRGAAAFNSYDDEARVTTVLLHFQHALEMLLKAGLVQTGIRLFDPTSGKSFGLKKCVNLGLEHLKLTAAEAGTIRALDAMRDEEQHWFAEASEAIIYTHVRAAVTVCDDTLRRIFGDCLANHLPIRVLPISAEPPRDIQLLIDEQYSQVKMLLKPGNRRGPEARARIRSLLAMEAHVADDVEVNQRDVDRIEKAIRAGKTRAEVFPRVDTLMTETSGEGLNVIVRFTNVFR